MKKHLFDQLKGNLQKEGYSPKGIVAIFVFGAITLVFILFGYSGKHNTIGAGAAGQVNETLISVADLKNETRRLEQMYAPMLGGQMGGDAQRKFIQQQALENLVSQELLAQGAHKMGVLTTDLEVRDLVTKEIPAFQEEGKFKRERYLAVLQANQWSAGEFETRLRKERGMNRLRRVLEGASTPLALEVQKMKEMKEAKRNIEFVKLEKLAVAEKMPISDGEALERLKDTDFSKRVQNEFDGNKATYGSEEKVKASHILVKFKSGDKKSEDEALVKIQKIAERAQREDFGKLAAAVSEDMGSKSQKGDLGFFTKGKMVPEFEKAAFALKPGVLSAPVKSQFGYHLIKVSEHQAATEPQFEKSKLVIAKKVIATEKYDSELKKIETALEAGKASEVESILKGLGQTWEETGFFDATQEMAPKLNSAVATSAALELSEKAPYAKKISRDAGAVFVLKWKATKVEPLASGENLHENTKRDHSYELLNEYLSQAKKDATIERNTKLD